MHVELIPVPGRSTEITLFNQNQSKKNDIMNAMQGKKGKQPRRNSQDVSLAFMNATRHVGPSVVS